MPRWFTRRWVPVVVGVAVAALSACTASSANESASGNASCTPPAVPTIIFAAYSTPREVYDAKIIPAFKAMWKDQTGVEPQFFESYTGSTTQAQNVVNGSGADVVALSLAPDVQTIDDAGLITHDWTSAPDKGMVSSSVVVFDVRPGNPKGIANWNDLATLRHRAAHARPGPERRRPVEPHLAVGLRDPRRRAGDQQGRRGRRDDPDERRGGQRASPGTRAPAPRSRTSRAATATSRSPTRTRSRRRRPAGSPTRPCTRRARS